MIVDFWSDRQPVCTTRLNSKKRSVLRLTGIYLLIQLIVTERLQQPGEWRDTYVDAILNRLLFAYLNSLLIIMKIMQLVSYSIFPFQRYSLEFLMFSVYFLKSIYNFMRHLYAVYIRRVSFSLLVNLSQRDHIPFQHLNY